MSKEKEPTTARAVVLKALRISLTVLFAKENPKGFVKDVMKKRNDDKK